MSWSSWNLVCDNEKNIWKCSLAYIKQLFSSVWNRVFDRTLRFGWNILIHLFTRMDDCWLWSMLYSDTNKDSLYTSFSWRQPLLKQWCGSHTHYGIQW
jgi:hypothetical protein